MSKEESTVRPSLIQSLYRFQEFDLSTEAMFRYTSYREDLWRAAIEQALSNQGAQSYSKVGQKRVLLLYHISGSDVVS